LNLDFVTRFRDSKNDKRGPDHGGRKIDIIVLLLLLLSLLYYQQGDNTKPMASFINHKTSLSRLQAHFQDVYAQFAVDDDDNHTTTTTTAVNPQDFVQDSRHRIQQTEKRLLHLTHQVFPDTHDALTATQVARAVHELQMRYLAQLTAVQRRVVPVATAAQPTATSDAPTPVAAASQPTRHPRVAVPQHWSVGRMLSAVPETEHETDTSLVTTGKSTASSTFFASPVPATTTTTASGSRRRRSLMTSRVPLLERHDETEEMAAGSDPRDYPCFEEDVESVFQEEDLVITATLSSSPPRTSTERRVDAFTELEERLRQDIHRAQQLQAAAPQNAAVAVTEEEEEEEETMLYYYEGESMTVETETPTVVANRSTAVAAVWEDVTQDDSALDCPTVVHQTTPWSASHRRQPLPVTRGLPRRPSHIEFDPQAVPASPSPSTVNLTLDDDEQVDDWTAHLDQALAGLLPTVPEQQLYQHEDNVSLGSQETPVLDRYRLAPDAAAPHGFVVVPNPRRRPLPVLAAARRPVVSSHKHDPNNKGVHWDDENAPLNLAQKRAWNLVGEQVGSTARGPTATTTTRRPLAVSHLEEEEEVQATTSPGTFVGRRPQQHQPRQSSSSRAGGLPSSFQTTRTAARSSPHRGAGGKPLLAPISREEYEASPRVVKMQVSLAQVQQAILLWNAAAAGDGGLCTKNTTTTAATTHAVVTDAQVAKVWRPLLAGSSADRQRQTLLMSLCHWRRLVLRRTASGTTVYEVVVAPVATGHASS
jgi:hypothetical protein